MKNLLKIFLSSILLITSSFAFADLNVLNLSYRTGPFAITGIPLMDGMLDYSTLLNERDGGIGGEKYRQQKIKSDLEHLKLFKEMENSTTYNNSCKIPSV